MSSKCRRFILCSFQSQACLVTSDLEGAKERKSKVSEAKCLVRACQKLDGGGWLPGRRCNVYDEPGCRGGYEASSQADRPGPSVPLSF